MSTLRPHEIRQMENSEARKRFHNNQELINPCLKEHNLSLKCLDDNNYDHTVCKPCFENYKTCKLFWNKIMTDRKRQNIVPYLPLPEERNKIKAETLSSLKN